MNNAGNLRFACTGLIFSLLSLPAAAQSQYASHSVVVETSTAPSRLPVVVPNASLTEGFEGDFPPTGWIVRNQSSPVGINTNCWNQFTTTPWPPHSGSAHAGANFNCTAGDGTISGWLITDQIADLQNGDQVSFWTRKSDSDIYPDRLQVLLCLDTTPDSCGLDGSTGSSETDVGSFTTVVFDINPTLVTGVYPTTYTQFSVTLSGLPTGLSNGRLAFRYFVTDAGPDGNNSDIISIDDVSIVSGDEIFFDGFEAN